MKRARLLVLAIAVTAALVAGWLAFGLVPRQETKIVESHDPTVKVLVAQQQISVGDILRSNDLVWQTWPKDAAAEGYLTQSARPNAQTELADSIARAAFLKGEPIKPEKLIKSGEGGVLAAILPAGMRAVSTKISEDTAAGGWILPNDRVDVIVTKKQHEGGGRPDAQVSETLFRNIRVLAIGTELDHKDNHSAAIGKTATLELTSNQAEILALNNSSGEISLALRSLQDVIKTKGASPDDDVPKKDRQIGVKVLRYGVWSRSYGVQ
jgi:pilus assembly protein CpaB